MIVHHGLRVWEGSKLKRQRLTNPARFRPRWAWGCQGALWAPGGALRRGDGAQPKKYRAQPRTVEPRQEIVGPSAETVEPNPQLHPSPPTQVSSRTSPSKHRNPRFWSPDLETPKTWKPNRRFQLRVTPEPKVAQDDDGPWGSAGKVVFGVLWLPTPPRFWAV